MDRYELAWFMWCAHEFDEVPEKVVSPNWMIRMQYLGVGHSALADRYLALADAIIERLGKGSVAGYQIGSKIYRPDDVTVIRSVPETQGPVSNPSFGNKMRSIAEAAQAPVAFDPKSYLSVSMMLFLDEMQAAGTAELNVQDMKLYLRIADNKFHMVDLIRAQQHSGEAVVAMFLAEVARISYGRQWKGNFRG